MLDDRERLLLTSKVVNLTHQGTITAVIENQCAHWGGGIAAAEILATPLSTLNSQLSTLQLLPPLQLYPKILSFSAGFLWACMNFFLYIQMEI